MADTPTQNGDSQPTIADTDVTMGEADADADVEAEAKTNCDEKKDVKLEDLFADADSDEEFPSSRPAQVKPSSSPAAPSSPLYGNCFDSRITN